MSRQSRKPKGKLIRPTFFVFCEGETEEAYISFLRAIYRLPIIIDAKITSSNISDKYISNYKKTKDTDPKDRTYLMYDLDVPEMLVNLQSLRNATLISSNPCFELWYLLHFQDQKSELTSDECMLKLTKILRDYKKGCVCEKMKEKLIEKQDNATSRAQKLSEYSNPSTKVYKLIEDLEEFKREENLITYSPSFKQKNADQIPPAFFI